MTSAATRLISVGNESHGADRALGSSSHLRSLVDGC